MKTLPILLIVFALLLTSCTSTFPAVPLPTAVIDENPISQAEQPANTSQSDRGEGINPTPESEGIDPPALAALVEIVSAFVQDDKIVGAELAVIKNRKILLHEAFGWQDKEKDSTRRSLHERFAKKTH